MLMIGADFADHLLGGRPAVHGARRKIEWNLVNRMVAWMFAAVPRDPRLRLHDKAVQEITGANSWKPHIRIIRRGDAAFPKPCCPRCPTEQMAPYARGCGGAGASPTLFFWPTEIKKFCLGVNSVTPKPFVSISFVSTGTKFGHVTMISPTWIKSEKAISHCQFLSLIEFVLAGTKLCAMSP